MIYIVEDDQEIREMEVYALQSAGLKSRAFGCAKDMYQELSKSGNEKPNMFILDIMLPEEDGLSILAHLRSEKATANMPVMMLTAKGTELDKVKGLDSGADDYLTKPFGILEFLSRVKALLRRAGNTVEVGDRGDGLTPTDEMANNAGNAEIITFEGVQIDDGAHVVTACGEPVELTYKEYELLKMLVSRPGFVFSRQQIMERVWGVDFEMETRTVDMHIKTLRQKLGKQGSLIQTIRNVGYKVSR
ncbi:MAG: response regulator transcription factor [Fibrobacteraceae bacterium]|nr:response regulator transcription factor [Fibrobacteraceae bacterium]